ncbi:murein transglycosylase A [Halodesulfovibrio marinisediminis]|uniref:peptidoglycan lytic exotransglycosylase n=1 Tax=Halodesulfovibrio marinisediminis DSM 17456 TaxID=1121457 RepID=A0A1N6IK42_9BACT|nr:MltA domain-containing protein [Halodesulfovibrio marinisediminis]SIO32404.1 membrane-bound lytic murein transglycosylase A [Halodesulfovibrio marinisediminis DSM 17456]
MTVRNITQILSALLIITTLFFAGCSQSPPPPEPSDPVKEQPEGARFIQLSDTEACSVSQTLTIGKQGMHSWMDFAPALERSAKYVSRKPQSKLALNKYGLKVTWKTLATSIERLQLLLPKLDSNPELLAQHFIFYRIDADPLFTGYYEPALQASLVKKPGYAYPLYSKPADLMTLNLADFHPRWKSQRAYYRIESGKAVPYYDRKSIDMKGALEERNLEIAWAKDPLDIFFLQIQGSGRLILEDGSTKHILYAGKNGHKYVSLGRVMRDKGLLPKDGISMQAIRKYFDENPEETYKLLATNPSYVFFRLADNGPYGSMGQPLTPRVSLATDPSFIPLGSMFLFDVPLPEKDEKGAFQYGDSLKGLGLAQDTGGAIKKHHLDFFSGYGEDATWIAGHMNTKGAVWLLLPK